MTRFSICLKQTSVDTVLPFNSPRTSKIVQCASKAFLRDMTHFHWHKKASQLQKIQQLENFIKSFVDKVRTPRNCQQFFRSRSAQKDALYEGLSVCLSL
jgi:hypothetical protein